MCKTLKLIRHERRLCNEEVDGRDGEELRDLEFFVILEEFGEVEPGHPKDGAAGNGGVDEVALAAGDVGGWEMGERAVFEGIVRVLAATSGEVFADLVLRD